MISSPSQGFDAKTEPLKELAIETLLSFPSRRTSEVLLQDIDFIHDVWISPTMIRRCLNQVWGQYGKNLHDHSRESAWEIAKDLHENGKHPVPSAEPEKDSGWVNWFSGPNLRWEMIGILFSWAGMAFKRKQEWDHIFGLPEQEQRDRRTTADRMRECALACLKFSQEFPEINDIKLCLMKNTVKLQSIIFSDEYLCEEDVYGGPERLAIAVSKLSPGGWNTDGKIYTTTWARADCLLAPIREGILKLALSVEDQFSKTEVE
ncbi:hypothetical protein ACEPPN_002083 [Leptodophora sp. 'Broadleaf-Isolate-01']